MSDLEAQLLEFWTASAEVWRKRTAFVGAETDETTQLGADEARMTETWSERKARQAAEREAIKAASMPKRLRRRRQGLKAVPARIHKKRAGE